MLGRLDGANASERAQAERHRAGCGACRELWALVATEPAADDAACDLVTPVLAHTTGTACGAARGQLPALVDGELTGLDAELARGHVADCGDCGALARAMTRLQAELPGLAEVVPDARFAADVAARTWRRPGWRRPIVAAWERWARRPRLAWELAYVATVAVSLALPATGTSVAAVPRAVAGLVSLELEEPVDRLERGVRRGIVTSAEAAEGAVVEPSRARAARIVDGIETSYGKVYANVGTFVGRLAFWRTDDDASRENGDGPKGDGLE
jgi:predicted anti-sigma-YlaC factor YlaD